MIPKKKQPREGKSLADRGIFVRKPGEISKDIQNYSDSQFYDEVWNEREHVCFETGRPLEAINLLLFHHILPKAKYPQYRYEKWNIVLLHPDSHSQVETFIGRCPRVQALTEHLKIVYG